MRRTFWIIVALAIGFVSGWLTGRSWRPDYPEKWDRIRVNMMADEIVKIEPRLSSEMREVKGFDQMAIDYGDRSWQLLVYFDSTLRADRIVKQYVFKSCGFWNKTISEGKQKVDSEE